MRIPEVRGFTVVCRYSLATRQRRYLVKLWKQPVHHWLWAQIYHWYDMRICRVPGFRKLEDWLRKPDTEDYFDVPLSVKQDLRCYWLMRRGRSVLLELTVSSEEYELWQSRTKKTREESWITKII